MHERSVARPLLQGHCHIYQCRWFVLTGTAPSQSKPQILIAKQLAEALGGRISIESSNDVREYGTNVHVFLPSVASYGYAPQ